MFHNQKLLKLVIISCILVTLVFESGVILLGEIRCWSLLIIKGLNFSMSIKKCSTHLSSLEGDILVTGCSCGRNQHNNN